MLACQLPTAGARCRADHHPSYRPAAHCVRTTCWSTSQGTTEAVVYVNVGPCAAFPRHPAVVSTETRLRDTQCKCGYGLWVVCFTPVVLLYIPSPTSGWWWQCFLHSVLGSEPCCNGRSGSLGLVGVQQGEGCAYKHARGAQCSYLGHCFSRHRCWLRSVAKSVAHVQRCLSDWCGRRWQYSLVHRALFGCHYHGLAAHITPNCPCDGVKTTGVCEENHTCCCIKSSPQSHLMKQMPI